MTILRRSTQHTLGLTGLLAMLAMLLGWWQATVFRLPRAPLREDAWERVQQRYPMPQTAVQHLPVTSNTLEAVVQANPFSPKRRVALVPSDGSEAPAGTTPGIADAEPQPTFVYKGRIALGGRSRAIVEDRTTQKTHFLEVGQEVAGFKVLDMTENRVVLSDPQTRQEVVVSLTSSSPSAPRKGTSGQTERP